MLRGQNSVPATEFFSKTGDDTRGNYRCNMSPQHVRAVCAGLNGATRPVSHRARTKDFLFWSALFSNCTSVQLLQPNSSLSFLAIFHHVSFGLHLPLLECNKYGRHSKFFNLCKTPRQQFEHGDPPSFPLRLSVNAFHGPFPRLLTDL